MNEAAADFSAKYLFTMRFTGTELGSVFGSTSILFNVRAVPIFFVPFDGKMIAGYTCLGKS
ncbi:hypothetical protein KUL42_32900 [Alteromonas sp. KUL42]|nr:hypothetical protein KUL42_32900 [Alteromonas sp. KUL42]